MEISVLVPYAAQTPEQALPFAALVRSSQAARLWHGQTMTLDAAQAFSALAGAGVRVPAGTGVDLMPLRHPLQAALQSRSLAMTTGCTVTATYGLGAVVLQQALLGKALKDPIGVAREYLTIMRGLLSGELVRHEGEHYTVLGQLPPASSPRIELGLGVLQAGMARLAGEVADVAMTWLAPPSYLREVVGAECRMGAQAAGRETPRLIAAVPVVLTAGSDDPVPEVMAGNEGQLTSPAFISMLRGAGATLPRRGADPAEVARGAIEVGAVVAGTPDEIVQQLMVHREAGVGEVVLDLSGTAQVYGPQAALVAAHALVSRIDDLRWASTDRQEVARDGQGTTA